MMQDDGPFHAVARLHVSLRFEKQGRTVPEDDVDLLEWGDGWVSYQVRSTGKVGRHVIEPEDGG